jgi:hypothetical protein
VEKSKRGNAGPMAHAVTLAALTGLMVAVLTAPAHGQPSDPPIDPPPDGVRSALPRGAAIEVKDRSGRRTAGVFRGWSNGALVVLTDERTPALRRFALDDIDTVTSDDSQKNGFWIGLAVGTVPGLVFGSLLSQRCYNEKSRHCPEVLALFGTLSGLAGGGLGAAIDGAFYRGPLVYSGRHSGRAVRVAPVLSPESRSGGVSFTVAF